PSPGRDPYVLVQEAKALLVAGKFKGVLDIVEGLIKEHPRSQSSHLLRALALDGLGRYDEAELSYKAALRIVPKDPQILTRLGMHYLRREAWDDAVRHLELSRAIAADDVETLFYLAQAHFKRQNVAKALEAIERCAELAPANSTVLFKVGEYRAHARKYMPALEALLKVQTINPEEPDLDLALGIVYLSVLDIPNARASLDRAEKKNPENLAVISNLAEVCAQARDHAAARRYYQELLDRGQHDAEYYLGLGAALVGLGEHEAASAALKQAVEKNPKMPEAHFHLARVYRSMGLIEEAQRELRVFKVLKENPLNPLDKRTELEQNLWRRLEALVKDGKEEEALKLLDSGNAPDGNRPEYLVGALYYLLGRFQDAERLFNEVMKTSPILPKLGAYLGLTYMEMGRIDEAERVINEELARNPKDSLVLMAMGRLCFQRKNWAEAERYLQESRVVIPEALLMLCEAQIETGRKDQAQETAQTVVTLAAGDETVLAALNRLLERHKLRLDADPSQAVATPAD
ncbi:MAG: tetratricopeptide repeat protein, partial [Vicinamibacteria bacterium]|nr:tetratricopeptide repeat protein [Vicinamibacteria bacterium]